MERGSVIKEGSDVLIHLKKGKNWVVKVGEGKRLHTHLGYLDLGALIGKKYGSQITSSKGHILWALPPATRDYVEKSRRETQIIYPKDAGLLVIMTNIHPGAKVVEVGTGSGALTTHLANLVRPHGHVYSYERRPEFAEMARENLSRVSLQKFVTVRNLDAVDGIKVRNADAAVIDVGDPWNVINPVWKALKGGGHLVSVSPTMNQVEKFTVAMENLGFIDIETTETLLRHIEGRAGKTRPAMRMIGHTAYLTFARKILKTRQKLNPSQQSRGGKDFF